MLKMPKHHTECLQGDDPPYLSVGTEVSAKYKGAFCEAKIRKVVRSVKCRVTYKQGLGTATVADDQIKGTLRVGASVEARHSEKKDFVEATITKIQDCSQYTVVFDDGDITTLRRTALCLKSGRHFAESETLDQLPLTHPEHFGNPVIGGRRGRRSRQAQDDSSEDEGSPPRGSPSTSGVGGKEGVETEPEIGRVVCVELGDKKKKDNWFPGLVVAPTAQDTVRIRVRDDYLVRSFKDARYYTVPKKEAIEFTKELGVKVENSALKVAVEKALLFLEKNELPPHWDRDSLFGNALSSGNSDSDADLDSDSSDDEPREEKDHFVAQLYKFMDDRGTPINNPMIGTGPASQDLDLYRLFRAVYKLGGYNRVTNQSRWKLVTRRLCISMQSTPATHNLVKQAYKKFLHSFEDFYRKLGCTMVNHPRGSTRKPRPGRSLIRDKDRNTPVPTPQQLIPKVEKIEDEEKKPVEEEKREQPIKTEPKPLEEIKIKKEEEPTSGQESDVNIEGESAESSSSEKSQKPARFTPIPLPKVKPKKEEVKKKTHEKRKEPSTPSTSSSKKKDSEKKEEETAKTRSKSKEDPKKEKHERETRTPSREPEKRPNSSKQRRLTDDEMKKQRGRKKREDTEKPREKEESGSDSAPTYKGPIQLGDRLKVYYGPTHESKVTYEAKVIGIQCTEHEDNYLVHYTGWNTRYDEWIKASRIAQNFTQSQTRVKRTKTTPRPQTPSTTSSKSKTPSSSVQSRRRAQSVAPTTSKLSSTSSSTSISSAASTKEKEPARSTTPLSVASSSSRTKSPATPAGSRPTRGARSAEQAGVEFRRRTRRMSGHTDLSVASESEDSEAYETDTTEPERARTRSRGTEDRRRRDVRRRVEDRIKPEENSEGDDEKEVTEPRRTRRPRRTTSKTAKETRDEDDDDDDEADEDDNEENDEEEDEDEDEEEVREAFERVHGHDEQPKGRDFDLNQIRSELKGFDKAVKMEVIRMEPENSGDEDVKPNIEDLALEIKEEKIELPEEDIIYDEKPVLEAIKPGPPSLSPTEDVYEFKEPEPFEFEVRNKRDSSGDKEKSKKRMFDDEQPSKSPKKKQKTGSSPQKEPEVEVKRKKKVKRPEESPERSPNVSSKIASPQPPSPATPKDPEKVAEASPAKVTVVSPPPAAPTLAEEAKSSVSVNLFFSEAPETEDAVGEPDDHEDRLVISESEVAEAETVNPFTYVAELFPGPIPAKSDFTTEVDIKEEHEHPLPQPQPVVTAVLASSLVAPVLATNLSTTPTLERKLMEAKLSSIASLTATLSTPLVPAPISARLPATSSIEEKLSAMAYRHMKPKDSRRDDDESRKGKDSQKKAEAKRTKAAAMTADEAAKKDEEAAKLEEERSREVARAIKQKEEELELVKARKEAELKNELKKIDVKIKREDDWPELEDDQLQDLKEAEKRRKKVLSQEFVDSTDSSDSEQKLVIEDVEQEVKFEASNFDVKLKAELDLLPDDPALLQDLKSPLVMDTKIIISIKNEEEGENMNLLCEEEIPGSPAPALDALDPEGSRNRTLIKEEPVEKKILLVEMPFASAPTSGQSTSGGMGLATTSGAAAAAVSLQGNVVVQRQDAAHLPLQAPRRESNEAAPVMDNTPPTTPDSTLSNMSVSPRDERVGGSPLSEENGKHRESSEGDNDSGGKGPSLYGEDDVLIADGALERATKGCKRPLDDPGLLKKRKRSRKNSECGSNAGKKPIRQSTRQTRTSGNGNGSDSDDTSEASSNHGLNNPVGIVTDISVNGMTDLNTRITPKPTKYNFYVELDPELDGSQRIAVLQQKLTDLKKTYNAVKVELAAIERRRKKLRRREREAMKAAKAEMQQACA